jgi:hypothetical protein
VKILNLEINISEVIASCRYRFLPASTSLKHFIFILGRQSTTPVLIMFFPVVKLTKKTTDLCKKNYRLFFLSIVLGAKGKFCCNYGAKKLSSTHMITWTKNHCFPGRE